MVPKCSCKQLANKLSGNTAEYSEKCMQVSAKEQEILPEKQCDSYQLMPHKETTAKQQWIFVSSQTTASEIFRKTDCIFTQR